MSWSAVLHDALWLWVPVPSATASLRAFWATVSMSVQVVSAVVHKVRCALDDLEPRA